MRRILFYVTMAFITVDVLYCQDRILFDIGHMVIVDAKVESNNQGIDSQGIDSIKYNSLLIMKKRNDTALSIAFNRSSYDEMCHSENIDMECAYSLCRPFKINFRMYFPDLKEEKTCTITCDSYVRDLVVVPTGITDDKKYKITIPKADTGLAVVTNNEDYIDVTNNDNHSNKECCIA